MRLKFVFVLMSSAALILGTALFLKQYLEKASVPPTKAKIKTLAPESNISSSSPFSPAKSETKPSVFVTTSNTVTNFATTSVFIPPAPVATNTLTPEQRQVAIDAETDRLQQWSMNDDPTSLSNILTDLTNPEKQIREAAIEATKQFGSASAIPALKAAAANTSDTEEQIDLLEAANFLSLPSMNFSGPTVIPTPEQIQAEEQKAIQRQNRRQAQMQKQTFNQNP
jgi:hypothetical protein